CLVAGMLDGVGLVPWSAPFHFRTSGARLLYRVLTALIVRLFPRGCPVCRPGSAAVDPGPGAHCHHVGYRPAAPVNGNGVSVPNEMVLAVQTPRILRPGGPQTDR